MKKLSTLSIIAMTMLLLASCTESKMKQFAEEFATAVNNNDKEAIAKMYPDAKVAEKLAIDFNKDSLSVEERADTFVVNLGGDKSLSIVKTEEGELKIADSHGLFSYPKERMDFALKTGWVKPEMSDLKVAEQFKDTMFIRYLAQKNAGQIKTKLVVKSVNDISQAEFEFRSGLMTYATTIGNDSEYEIPGSFYEIITDYGGEHRVTNGKDIKPGERKSFSMQFRVSEITPSSTIRFKVSDADLLAKFFTPKGGEYEAYKRSPLSSNSSSIKGASANGNDSGYDSILSDRKLTESDLNGKTRNELELMRNSIYARYGYRFKRDDLFNHFSQYSWYNPTTSDMTAVYNMASDIEKYNIDFIKRHE